MADDYQTMALQGEAPDREGEDPYRHRPNPFDAVRNMTYVPADRALIRTEDVWQTQTERGCDGYSDTVVALCANFDNAGYLADANAVGMCGRSKHGEEACLISMAVDPDTLVVRDAAFRASGTLAMIASASLAAYEVLGKTLGQVLQIDGPTLRAKLGAMPADRASRPFIAAEALHAAVGDFYVRAGLSLDEVKKAVPCDESSVACLQCEHCSYKTSRLDLYMRELGLEPRRREDEDLPDILKIPV